MVVVAIIGILSAVGIVSYNGYVWSSKKTSAKNIMQQMSLAQTEYISNNGSYFDSTDDCSTSASSAQSTEINVKLLFSETIVPAKLGFNMCVQDTSGDDVGYDYTIKAVATKKTCTLAFHSNGAWEDDDGEGC